MTGKKCGGCMMIAFVLVIIGALNWGLVGIGGYLGGNWNVVELILGSIDWLEDLVYLLVGISGLVLIFGGKGKCETKEEPASAQQM